MVLSVRHNQDWLAGTSVGGPPGGSGAGHACRVGWVLFVHGNEPASRHNGACAPMTKGMTSPRKLAFVVLKTYVVCSVRPGEAPFPLGPSVPVEVISAKLGTTVFRVPSYVP